MEQDIQYYITSYLRRDAGMYQYIDSLSLRNKSMVIEDKQLPVPIGTITIK